MRLTLKREKKMTDVDYFQMNKMKDSYYLEEMFQSYYYFKGNTPYHPQKYSMNKELCQ